MANICENSLKVEGDKKELEKFMGLLVDKEGAIDFGRVVPMPKELEGTKSPSDKPNRELIKKFGADNWYDWNVKNWGTKWSPYDGSESVSYEKGDSVAFLDFDTAWSPCGEFIKNASKTFKKLKFVLKYDEPGMCFMGVSRAEKGKLTDNCQEY